MARLRPYMHVFAIIEFHLHRSYFTLNIYILKCLAEKETFQFWSHELLITMFKQAHLS